MTIRKISAVLCALGGLASLTLSGCGGTECGEGTVEMDGRCVPDMPTTCGDGTVLMDGMCVPESTVECGAGSELVDGACRPSAAACADGTTYDMATRECVPDTAIVCGPGTEVGADGTCVPDPDAICADGTSYDSATESCVPDVTCRADQVPLDGFCVSPAEVDRSMADVTETSPDANDPAFGGTAEALTLPGTVGDSTIFAGVIDAPADLDADTVLDQDADAWQFTASAGDVIQISLRNLGDLQLGFRVDGPSGFSRLSPLYIEAEPSRYLFLPYDGEYTVTVAPQTTIDAVFDVGPAGSAAEEYVGILSNVGPITATTLAADTPTNGIFPDLRDQLFQIEVAADEFRRVVVDEVGADVTPVYLVLDGSGAFLREETDLISSPLLHRASAANDLHVLVDYQRLVGLENDFRITSVGVTATDLGTLDTATPTVSTTVTVPAGDSVLYQATALADTVVEIEATDGTDEVISVSDSSGPVTTGAGLLRLYRATGGPIFIEVTNDGASDDDYEITLTSYTPVDLGTFDAMTMTSGSGVVASLPPRTSAYFKASSAAALRYTFSTSQSSSVDLDLFAYDSAFTELASSATSASNETVVADALTPGITLVRVFNFFSATTGSDVTVTATSEPPPVVEAEPNDAPATAQALPLDIPYVGSIVEGDTDFVRITLAAALTATELLHVRVDSSSGGDDWTCRLWDGTATTTLQEQTPREDGCVLYVDGLAAGDYLVELVKAGSATRDYSLLASVIPGVLEVEPNDASGTATAVDPFGVPVYGEVPLNTDTDVFTFNLATAGFLDVRAEAVGTNSTGTMDIDLAGPSGEAESAGISGNAIVASASAGAWEMSITRTSSTPTFSGWYRLTATSATVTPETEANDDPTTANGPFPVGEGVSGVIATPTTGDDDYFAFTLASALGAGQELVVQMYRTGGNPSSSLRLTVFDTDGTTSLDSTTSSDPREIRLSGLPAGTYYVRADATFDTTFDTDYTILISVE